MQLRFLFVLFFVFTTAVSYGQFWKKKKSTSTAPAENSQANQPNSLTPTSNKENAPKASRKNSSGPTYESEQKYYERMAALEKLKRKEEEMRLKPQYSDPMYFGHKRPPKKHKPGKMKYCKECGIRH